MRQSKRRGGQVGRLDSEKRTDSTSRVQCDTTLGAVGGKGRARARACAWQSAPGNLRCSSLPRRRGVRTCLLSSRLACMPLTIPAFCAFSGACYSAPP